MKVLSSLVLAIAFFLASSAFAGVNSTGGQNDLEMKHGGPLTGNGAAIEESQANDDELNRGPCTMMVWTRTGFQCAEEIRDPSQFGY